MRTIERIYGFGPSWFRLLVTLRLRTPILVGCSWFSARRVVPKEGERCD